MDTKLLHTVPDRAGVPEVAESNPRDALADTVAGRSITKPAKLLREWFAAVRAGVDADFLLDRHLGIVA